MIRALIQTSELSSVNLRQERFLPDIKKYQGVKL